MSQQSITRLTTEAEKTLAFIENRTAHILTKLLLAVYTILNRLDDRQPLLAGQRPTPTLYDLDDHVEHWRFLVPDDVTQRAALIHVLAERYTVTPDVAPALRAALHMDDTTVQAAYESLFDTPLTTVYQDAAPPPPEMTVERHVASYLEWVLLRRGDVLYHERDPGDSLYVIVNGLLRVVFGHSTDVGDTPFVTELDNGEMVGEMAMLAGEPRGATVYAVRDTELIKFTSEHFRALVEEYPSLMAEVAIRMGQRLSEVARATRQPEFKPVATVALLFITPGCATFAQQLSAVLDQYGATLHLKPDNINQFMQAASNGRVDLETYVDEYDFIDSLQRLTTRYPMILYEADPAYPGWTRRCISEADRILLVGRADESPDLSAVEQIMLAMPHQDLLPQRELVLLHDRRTDAPRNTRRWLDRRHVERHHHVALDDRKTVERVGRYLRGKAIGLVFGGGGMRGAAHTGVIQVLNERGIHADVVGGTSSGALVAAQYALGWDVDEMTRVSKEKFFDRRAIMQPTFPWVSFSSARFLNEKLVEAFGAYEMEDLWTTAFTVSLNWTTAKTSVNLSGKLSWAVRASSSIAGTYPPTPDANGDLHIDGGGADNTPADVARKLVGQGPVIAIDLGFTDRASVKYHYGDYLSGFDILFNRLNPFRREKIRVPTLIDIMLRANALSSINATVEQVKHADLLLQPPVKQFGLFELEKYEEIVQVGYDYAREALRDWLDAGGMAGVYPDRRDGRQS